MKFMQTEKKQLLIYVIIAYGITYVMGLLMWYSYGKGLDLSAFPNAQMLYPAAGVMMAYLITKKGDKNLPTAFYIFFVALTAVGTDHGVRYNRWQRYFLDSSSAIR